MSNDRKSMISTSFVTLYMDPEHASPIVPMSAIEERYALCKEKISMLTLFTKDMLICRHIQTSEVLARCHQVMQLGQGAMSEQESDWAVGRLAQSLGWAPLPATH